MAKKKRRTTAKRSRASKNSRARANEVENQSFVLRQVFAAVLIIVAIFIVLGALSAGGPLPTGLFSAMSWLFGTAAYITPIAFLFFGVLKFMSEDKKIPLVKLLSMLSILILTAGLLYVAFATEIRLGEYDSNQGGVIGGLVGGLVLSALSKTPSTITLLLLAIVMTFVSFEISPKVVGKPFGLFTDKDGDTEESDMRKLSQALKVNSLKLNEGVPIEHRHGEPVRKSKKPLIRGTKALETVSKQDDHSALTAPSDPDWKFPGMDLLNKKQDKADPGDVNANASIIKNTLENFSINVDMEEANIGPRVTQYTLKPPSGVKLSKITALDSNIALDLGAKSIRMEAPIPGKKAVGVEVPNVKPSTVRFSSVVGSPAWKKTESPLSIVIGKDIAGKPVVGALDKMPHLLVAGQTGSGKSVMINSLLTSLLYRNSPNELKLILVDPKQVEMAPYRDIPHLLTDVIVEPEKCISALKWAVAEMERRFKTLAENRKRNIADYNRAVKDQAMPYIVIVIDELADLMMVASKDMEQYIVRIAQKARAVGIHLVLATQRPSVNVITGLIKGNIPARIAFTVASQIDSRTIIDSAGAEKLLGMGDMLYKTTEMPRPMRVQGSFITDEETQDVMDFLKMQRPPQYDDEVVSQPVHIGKGGVIADYKSDGSTGEDDEFRDAVQVVLEARKASTSYLQMRLKIGYGKAARIIAQLEEQGIVGPGRGSKPREVLVSSMEEVFGGDGGEFDE